VAASFQLADFRSISITVTITSGKVSGKNWIQVGKKES
jgi:hypothetical protein